jgi:hypothetical protein
MALPSDEEIQTELMRLLLKTPGHKMRSGDVYTKLAESFPGLTHDERTVPYQNSVSHWANRVQFAVLHLRKMGWLRSPAMGGRGVWEISPQGKAAWDAQVQHGYELLKQLEQAAGARP